MKINKLQRRFLAESFRHENSHYAFVKMWNGKYYWGDYEIGDRPVSTKTLCTLVDLKLMEHINAGNSSLFRRTKRADNFLCRYHLPDKSGYCSGGKIQITASDDWPTEKCPNCEGFGVLLKDGAQ